MSCRFLYIFLLLIVSVIGYCQDIIVKKDGSQIICRVFEIKTNKIKYVEFNTRNDHKQKIKSDNVARIIFRNGDELRFNQTPGKIATDTTLSFVIKEKHNVKPIKKFGDFIQLRVIAGFLINESNNNYSPSDYKTTDSYVTQYRYYKSNNHKKNGFEMGVNLILGSSPYVQHVLGVNFSQSSGEFNFEKHSVNSDSTFYFYKSNTTNLNIKSTDHYLNIVNGIRVRLFSSFFIETCINFNIPTMHKSQVNGTILTRQNGSPNSYHFINDSIGTQSHVKPSFALNPRIAYEIKSKKGQKFGIQASCNFNFDYKLSWYTLGFTYYPFKKLR